MPSEEKRDSWSGRLDFIMSSLSMAIGMGNLWRFPYLCYRNGGGAFLIPFILMVVLVGMPIMLLECYMGQYCGLGVYHMWEMCPLLKGCGLSQLVINCAASSHYCMVIGYCLYYLFASFTSHLPWADCDNEWNTLSCMTLEKRVTQNNCTNHNGTFWNNTCYYQEGTDDDIYSLAVNMSLSKGKPVAASDEYFHNAILRISSGIHELGGIQWDLLLCLLLVWTLIFITTCRGIKSAGKAAYVTTIFPYIIVLVLLVRGVTLEGSSLGITYYLKPDIWRLLDIKVWGDAAIQVFFSMGLCIGALSTLSSFNGFHNNSIRDIAVLVIGDSLMSFLSGFIVFSYLGAMAHRLGVSIHEVATQGAGLALIVFPDAITMLPLSPLWSVLFMLMLVILGLGTMMCSIEITTTAVTDQFPILRKQRYFILLLSGICLASILAGLPLTTKGGMYILQLLDSYVATYALMMVAVWLCVAVAWCHGSQAFSKEYEMMFGHRPSPYWIIMTKFITPLIVIGILVFTLFGFRRSFYGDYVYPLGCDLIGWLLVVMEISIIPGMAIYQICTKYTDKPIIQRIKLLSQPSKAWKPQNAVSAEECHKMEPLP